MKQDIQATSFRSGTRDRSDAGISVMQPCVAARSGNKSGHVSYRPDIDGLRAIAVLSVVIFHAFPRLLPGGFTGVDIFFVISGFLITGILLVDLQTGQFSVGSFYARRVRRIFPALATVLLAAFAMGWYCLSPHEYKELGKHILAGAAFVSNWALWAEGGYFDQAASAKPLLHLWSLGVEEQFYMVWPLLLWMGFRFRKISWLCAGVALASFAVNIALIPHDASAAFYWPVARMWEFLGGSALALWTTHPSYAHCIERWRHKLSASGALLLVISFLFLNASLAFPGSWAVLPVLGAGLLIAAGPKGFLNLHLLNQPAAIWMGKNSYAWYLWHWPLLSFAFVLSGGEPTATVRGTIAIGSLLLAWLTTTLVERPVRLGAPAKWKLVVPCLLMTAIAYVGAMTYLRDGLGFRPGYKPIALGEGHEFVEMTCGVQHGDQKLYTFCATDRRGPVHYVVWGDSKADALYWGLVRKSPADKRWMLIARASCAPMTGVERTSSTAGNEPELCRDANRRALQMLLARPDLSTVVLVMADRDVTGQTFAYDGQAKATASATLVGLDNSITALERAGRRVGLVLDNPRLRDPTQCIDRRPLTSPLVRRALGLSETPAAQRCAISYRSHVAEMAPYRSLVDQLKARHPDLFVYDPAGVLCDVKKDVCPMVLNQQYLYSYQDHVSDYANGLMADQFLPMLASQTDKLPRSSRP